MQNYFVAFILIFIIASPGPPTAHSHWLSDGLSSFLNLNLGKTTIRPCPPGQVINRTSGHCETVFSSSKLEEPSVGGGTVVGLALQYDTQEVVQATADTCHQEGFFPDPTDCTKYYRCIFIAVLNLWVQSAHTCPPSYFWDASTNLCKIGDCPPTGETPTTEPGSSTLSFEETNTIEAEQPSSSSSKTSTDTVTSSITTTQPPPAFVCSSEGPFPDPADCTKYYRCILIAGRFFSWLHSCPSGFYYEVNKRLCVVGECTDMTTTVTSTTSTTTTEDPEPCVSEGVFPIRTNCGMYYRCVKLNDIWRKFYHTCPPDFTFDPSVGLCVEGPCRTTEEPITVFPTGGTSTNPSSELVTESDEPVTITSELPKTTLTEGNDWTTTEIFLTSTSDPVTSTTTELSLTTTNEPSDSTTTELPSTLTYEPTEFTTTDYYLTSTTGESASTVEPSDKTSTEIPSTVRRWWRTRLRFLQQRRKKSPTDNSS